MSAPIDPPPGRRPAVAVTGGAGRLGRYVVDELHRDRRVTVIDRQPPAAVPAKVDYRQVDLMDEVALRDALAGHDAVVHLAGIDLDRPADPVAFLDVNAVGTWRLLDAARDCGIGRVVLCSSVTASGLPEIRPDHPPRWLPVDESHPDNPCHPYGLGKLLAERIADAFTARGGMAVICLRPMMVTFPENIPRLRRWRDDPAHRWIFAHVGPEDCARAFRCALDAENVRKGVFYISASDSCAAEPTLDLMERLHGRRPQLRDPALYREHPWAAIFAVDAARRQLGFVPRQTWRSLTDGR